MATDLENLRTFKSNLLVALATWENSGLKEATVSTDIGTSVTYRSYEDLLKAIENVNKVIAMESPDMIISRGR